MSERAITFEVRLIEEGLESEIPDSSAPTQQHKARPVRPFPFLKRSSRLWHDQTRTTSTLLRPRQQLLVLFGETR